MGCSCSREGEVCLSNFCEGGACCAAPCELERAAEPAAPLFGGDEPIGIRQAVWRSGDGLATCDGVCTAHVLHEEHARPYEAEQQHDTPQQDMCATGGGVTYHTSQYEATFIIGVVVLVVLCTFAAYCKKYRAKQIKGEPIVVMATLVGDGSGLLPVAMPVGQLELSRISDVVEAVAVSLVSPPAASQPAAGPYVAPS